MSVQEQAHLIAGAEAIEIRPVITVPAIVVKVAKATVGFVYSVLFGQSESQALQSWATVERVKWHPGIRHEPPRPDRYHIGGFR